MHPREMWILGIMLSIFGVIALLKLSQTDADRPKVSPEEQQRVLALRKLYPDYSLDPDGAAAKLASLARESRGDVSKMPPEAKRWVDGMTAGHAREMIAIRYKELVKEDKKATRKVGRVAAKSGGKAKAGKEARD